MRYVQKALWMFPLLLAACAAGGEQESAGLEALRTASHGVERGMHAIHAETDYLTEPVAIGFGAHRIRIDYDAADPEGGYLYVDPNQCFLDAFGDTGGCTRMAIFSHKVRLRLIESGVDEVKMLFGIDIEDHEGPALRLAILPGQGCAGETLARLLVLDDAGHIARVIELNHIE